jgi:hypothetical protein
LICLLPFGVKTLMLLRGKKQEEEDGRDWEREVVEAGWWTRLRREAMKERESKVIFKRVLESVETGRDYLLRKIIDYRSTPMCEREFMLCLWQNKMTSFFVLFSLFIHSHAYLLWRHVLLPEPFTYLSPHQLGFWSFI